MIRRILALTRYFFISFLFSLSGLLFFLLALAFYIVFFDPRQHTPDFDYFILINGLFGIILAFLVTLSVAGRANKAVHFPFLVRLPSRVEYLTAVFMASFVYSAITQTLVAILAILVNGPDLDLSSGLEVIPLWTAGNILFISLALHATDLVAYKWSRVYVFGILGILLYLGSFVDPITRWLSGVFNRLGTTLAGQGSNSFSTIAFNLGNWISGSGTELLDKLVGFLFWPFEAISDAVTNGYFNSAQAMAPAVLLLYATFFYVLASSLFAKKDLHLSE